MIIVKLFNTLKYLHFIQIYYRLFYFARARWRKLSGFRYPLALSSDPSELILQPSIASEVSRQEERFTFLNLSHAFEKGIDWNYAAYGKLWTYNLTYFDFLNQPGMSRDEGLELIYDFIAQGNLLKDGREPFPVSLRGINWIKFLALHKVRDQEIDDSLYAQYAMLMDNLEYHLLGNHLLENGFSLLFGAYYFRDEKLYEKAREILEAELDEQILSDGAHFELSPMYHQIMLYRLLDCINLVQNNPWKQDGLLKLLENTAARMLGWLNAITYRNGDIPLLNDSANNIAPSSEELFEYAHNLKLFIQHSTLSESGYRKITKPRYECVIDVGPIGPDYIPGHAHADTFNFELFRDRSPFIVDTGLGTYETGERRDAERGTAAHNTVVVEGKNSSEVWGGFRVADRARIVELIEEGDTLTATHDGYRKLGVLHTRTWRFEEERIVIEDRISRPCRAVARLHFHPGVTEEMIQKHIKLNTQHPTLNTYDYSPEFNKTQKAVVMEIPFTQELKVEITL